LSLTVGLHVLQLSLSPLGHYEHGRELHLLLVHLLRVLGAPFIG
jgi:hypothetical protein